jgi:hypothetical protein
VGRIGGVGLNGDARRALRARRRDVAGVGQIQDLAALDAESNARDGGGGRSSAGVGDGDVLIGVGGVS